MSTGPRAGPYNWNAGDGPVELSGMISNNDTLPACFISSMKNVSEISIYTQNYQYYVDAVAESDDAMVTVYCLYKQYTD